MSTVASDTKMKRLPSPSRPMLHYFDAYRPLLEKAYFPLYSPSHTFLRSKSRSSKISPAISTSTSSSSGRKNYSRLACQTTLVRNFYHAVQYLRIISSKQFSQSHFRVISIEDRSVVQTSSLESGYPCHGRRMPGTSPIPKVEVKTM